MKTIFLFFIISILFKFTILSKANECDFQEDLKSFYSLSKFQYKEIDLNLQEYKYINKSKIFAKSFNSKDEIIYDKNEDHYYKKKENEFIYEKINLNQQVHFPDLEIYLNLVSQNQNGVFIGPTAVLSEISNEKSILEKNITIRSITTSVCSLEKKNLFGLQDVEIKVYFKLINKMKVPVRSTLSFSVETEKNIIIIDYYEFLNYNQIPNYKIFFKTKIVPSVSTKNMFDFDLEKPKLITGNKMKITYSFTRNDKEENKFITTIFDKEEKLYRYEAEKTMIFDLNNYVEYKIEDENCYLSYSDYSDEYFEKKIFFYFQDSMMITELKMKDFNFIGYDYQNNYELKIYQKINFERNIKTKLLFKENNLEKLINERYNQNNELTEKIVINYFSIEVLKYDKSYRELFSIKNCFPDQSSYIYAQVFTDHLNNDPNFPLKIKYFEKNKDEIVNKILLHFRDELGLRINSLNFAEIGRKNNYFVFNILILNVENYLINFKTESSIFYVNNMNFNTNLCAFKAIKNEKAIEFEFCQNIFDVSKFRCSIVETQKNLLISSINSKSSDYDCHIYRKRNIIAPKYNFNKIDIIFKNLVKKHFSIQFEHNIKFVFNNIRFLKKFSNFDDKKELFYLYKKFHKFDVPKKEFIDGFKFKILSVYDCYLMCKQQKEFDCNSFTFCEDTSKMIKCQLNDLVLSENDKQVENNSKDEKLIKDKKCYVYGLNYLNHFDAKGKSILAPKHNLKSFYTSSIEDCAKSCFFYNKNKDIQSSCGKIEFCETSASYLCNLKQLSNENSENLNEENCNYYKLNSLIDFQKTQFDENNNYSVYSYSKLKDCAKNCLIDGLSCTRFNFCLDGQNYSLKDDENLGICLRKTDNKKEKFENSKYPALTCISLIKNEKIYSYDLDDNDHRLPKSYNITRYKIKYIKEINNQNLKPNSFKTFIFTFVCLGILFGIFGFIYYNKSIGPSFNAEKGTYYPTQMKVIKTVSERLN